MAEACQIANEESHLEGFKWQWEFHGFNVFVATPIFSLHGVLCSSTWYWHESSTKSQIGGGVGCSFISLYALSFLMFKIKEQICTLSSTRPCWGGYNKQLVVLYHTLLWEQSSSCSDLKQKVILTFQKEALFCLSLSSQSPMMYSFSSLFQGLLSHNHCNWKEGYIISSVHQTRYSEVPTMSCC